jgi:hypothetical protein
MSSREKARFGKVMLTGVLSGGVGEDRIVLLEDGLGYALLVTGTTVTTDASGGFAKGCLFIDTNVAGGTSGLYVNVGTTASCRFKLVTNAA